MKSHPSFLLCHLLYGQQHAGLRYEAPPTPQEPCFLVPQYRILKVRIVFLHGPNIPPPVSAWPQRLQIVSIPNSKLENVCSLLLSSLPRVGGVYSPRRETMKIPSFLPMPPHSCPGEDDGLTACLGEELSMHSSRLSVRV